MPSVAFEVELGRSIFKALTKLKHAFDLWNTIPVLVTTEERLVQTKRWIEGSFHELHDVFRIIEWNQINTYYRLKHEMKNLEIELGIP